jgi:hypothetical protein
LYVKEHLQNLKTYKKLVVYSSEGITVSHGALINQGASE